MPATERRLRLVNHVAATAFVVGGSLFCAGAVLAQTDAGDPRVAAAVFLLGGTFFTSGGYASVLQVANGPREAGGEEPAGAVRWRWWATEAGDLAWWSAVSLFVGTLYFGASLLAALIGDLTPAQQDRLVWSPEIVGCALFLLSGFLALAEMGTARTPGRRGLGWWVVVVNQAGSVLFMVAAVAAFVRPSSGDELAVGLANWGTFAGAACFALAGAMQELERP